MDELTIIMEAVNGMTDGALYGFIFYVTYLTLTSIFMWGTILLIVKILVQACVKMNNAPEEFYIGKGELKRYVNRTEREEIVQSLNGLTERNRYGRISAEIDKICQEEG